MNKQMLEVRWHGRGGQGVKTAALLLADVAFNTGKYVQGFPEYGPERMGAPVTAYNRICDEPIRNHANIYEPQYVVVVDEGLLDSVNVTDGMGENTSILINSKRSIKEIRPQLNGYKGKICTIDAVTISEEILGTYYPNMPMLAAVVKMTQFMDEQVFMEKMIDSLNHKFASKPHVIEGNIQVLHGSLEEVKGL